MAEFIVGNPLRKWARKHKLLRDILWRVDYALVWSVYQVSRLLPADMGSRFGARLGRLIGRRLRRKSDIFRSNLATAFPDMNDAELDTLIEQCWSNAGRVLGEYAHLEDILTEPERLEIEIREQIPTYADPSRPCVVITAHQSNWEVVCSAMAKLGMPNASLYSPPTNPMLDRLLLESRRALNCTLVPRDNSARPLMRAMQQGRTAGMVADRRVDGGTPIRFFGRDKESTTLPAKLALKFGCELVPAQVQRLGDARFRVIFHPPVRPGDPQADEDTQAVDMIQQVHQHYESWIREEPAEWFCSKRLWPKVKMGSPKEVGDKADTDYAA